MTHADLLRDSLLELAVIDPIDPTPPELQTLALARYNGLLNLWNAQQQAVYAVLFPTYTTTSGLSPHTIGPDTATWSATQRPVAILGANQQIGSGTSLVNIGPLALRDRAWWLANAVPGVQAGVPTDLYYEPTWPNGSVYLWPVPNDAYTVQLELRVLLAEIDEDDVTDDFSLPPAYQRALMLTLAEDLANPLGQAVGPSLITKARDARAACFGNNNPAVRIRTRDSGMPGGPPSGGFNFLTGTGGGR